MFLNTEVLARGLRTTHRKRKRESRTGEEIQQTLGFSMVEGYVSALISLYNFQLSSGHNHHPHPRGTKIKAVLQDRLRHEHVRRKAEYVDRGANTLLDGYNQLEMLNVVRSCWTYTSPDQPRVPVSSLASAHRTALDFLMGHMMLLRGENRRHVQLADLFPLILKNEGPTRCTALIMILDNGKVNKTGRIEYRGVVRHKNLLLCVISQLAFYLFFQWNIVREPTPCFQQRQQWYDWYLLFGKTLTAPLSYATQLQWITQLFKAADVKSLKKTHVRGNGAREGEINGASEHQIRRAGGWNTDALSTSYLTHLPLEFVRVMAGFKPAPGDFYLPRAKVEPPLSLVQSLWPWVDQWQAWFRQNKKLSGQPDQNLRERPSYEGISLKDLPPSQEDRDDLAAQGFLELMCELRTILLQDSVLLSAEFPDHPLWKDPLFVRGDYLQFAQEVQSAMADVEEPIDLRLRKVVPDIALRLNTGREDIVRTVEHQGNRTYQLLESVHRQIDGLLSGQVAITLNTIPGRTSSVDGARTACTEPSSQPTTILSSLPPPSQALGHSASQSSYGVDAESSQHQPPLDPNTPPPPYEMVRSHITVPDLWREWTVGWGNGPAIQALEATYGARWRPSQKERMFFGRRKIIIDEIRRRTTLGKTTAAVIEEIELVRSRGKFTLHRLAEFLKTNNEININSFR